MNAKVLFALGLFFCLTPWASPPLALLAGLIFGAISIHPYKEESRTLSKVLLQSAVVGLGFGMNLQEVVRAGRSGFLYTALGIGLPCSRELCWGSCCRSSRAQRSSSPLVPQFVAAVRSRQ